MKKLLYLFTGLCLLAGAFTACEKPNSTREGDNGITKENYTETAFGMNLEMVYVEGGTFEMGATAEQEDKDMRDAKRSIQMVKLDSYYIGKFEVTQSQWHAVMGTTLEEQLAISKENDIEGGGGIIKGEGSDYPMYYVNWEEAQAFCQKLSEVTGKKYVLPTAAQWEYAARGGQYVDGTKYAGSNTIGDVAWYYDNSDDKTHPVGQKQANGLGLYDMSGNVEEWCSDWWEIYYSSSPLVNPQGPVEGTHRVFRGGDWWSTSFTCLVWNGGGGLPDQSSWSIGFRVACISE
ncbi:MAG: formylglycine-generating enzyme family protein [Bacteroidales bacterium]|nr:formylglycine-generating enzyme family protein [Bacteroidales bacterium]